MVVLGRPWICIPDRDGVVVESCVRDCTDLDLECEDDRGSEEDDDRRDDVLEESKEEEEEREDGERRARR